jgi:hypothetical protein
VIVFAGAMTVFSVLLSVRAAPWAASSLSTALARVTVEKPWAQLQPGVAEGQTAPGPDQQRGGTPSTPPANGRRMHER